MPIAQFCFLCSFFFPHFVPFSYIYFPSNFSLILPFSLNPSQSLSPYPQHPLLAPTPPHPWEGNGCSVRIAVEVADPGREVLHAPLVLLVPPPRAAFSRPPPPVSPSSLHQLEEFGAAGMRPVADAAPQHAGFVPAHLPHLARSARLLRAVSGYLKTPLNQHRRC